MEVGLVIGKTRPVAWRGFRNFPTHEYGMRSPRLRALARKLDIPRLLQVQPVSLEMVIPV